MEIRTGDQSFVKALNKAIVLNVLRRQAPISRADIAKVTGLNKATVSALVDELIADHMVQEIGTGASSGGRRPRLLVLNARAGLVVGTDLGVDYIAVAIQDLLGRPIWQNRIAHNGTDDPEGTLARLEGLIREGLALFPGTPLGLRGIGVGIPGLVDFEKGLLHYAPNLRWRDFSVGEWLAQRFGVPVKVDNEANAGALAEHWSGAGVGVHDLVYFSVGIGIGAGVILHDEIFRGHGGVAGELGHTTIDVTGPLCSCGNRGCLEAMASEAALRGHMLRSVSALHLPADATADLFRQDLSIAEIARTAEEGNAAAIAALSNVGKYLGVGVANAINVFNPQRVVIGGPIALAGRYILNPVRQVVEERALVPPRRQCEIVLSAHGPDACAVGAGALVLQDLFRLPAVVL